MFSSGIKSVYLRLEVLEIFFRKITGATHEEMDEKSLFVHFYMGGLSDLSDEDIQDF